MVLRDLRVFRGTYDEVMAQETENMTFYLAWDTQQLFVGNSLGAKVPYTGNSKTLIQKEFDEFKNKLLKEEITGYIKIYFDENEKRILEDIYKQVDGKISDLKTELLGSLDARSEEIAENTKNKLLNDADVAERIESITNEKVKEATETIVDDITEDVFQQVQTKVQADIDSINNAITENTESINNVKTDLNDAKNKLTSVESSINTIEEKVNKNTTDIEAANRRIDSISSGGDDTRLTELENKVNGLEGSISEATNMAENASKLAQEAKDLASSINPDTSSVKYLTGEKLTALSADLSKFTPAFCTSTYGTFKIGKLYYVDGNEIKSMASGSVVQQTIDAGLVLSYRTEEADGSGVSGTSFEIGTVGTIKLIFTISASHPEACKSITFDGSAITLEDNHSTVIANRTYSTDAAGTKTWTLSAVPLDATDEYKYTAESRSVSMTTYIPWLLGNEGKLVHLKPGNAKFTTETTPGLPVYFYADSEKVFRQGGQPVPFDSVELVNIEINGKIVQLYKHTIKVLNDTIVELDIIDK